MIAHTIAIMRLYPAIANPIDKASIEVAIPCSKRDAIPVFVFSASSLVFLMRIVFETILVFLCTDSGGTKDGMEFIIFL